MKTPSIDLKKFSIKDLLLIQNNASEYYKSFPSGAKLEGMKRALTDGEILTLSYLHAVSQFLKFKDILDKDADTNILTTIADSKTGG